VASDPAKTVGKVFQVVLAFSEQDRGAPFGQRGSDGWPCSPARLMIPQSVSKYSIRGHAGIPTWSWPPYRAPAGGADPRGRRGLRLGVTAREPHD
jgi:hypothetical protein